MAPKEHGAAPFHLRSSPMPYPFLSLEWIAAMRELRAEYAEHDREVEFDLAANATVTELPSATAILGHIDTTGPALTIEEGHLDNADFGIEVPWEVANSSSSTAIPPS